MNTNALIRTKLQRPTIDPDILPRSQLIARLENGRYRKLTLISAPAGYGKSILAGIWAGECACPVAWISLDEKDNELDIFVSYLICAVQTIFPDSFPETEELLSGQHLPSLDMLSTRFITEALSIPEPFIIMLDDYHVVTSRAISHLVNTLIQYLPANMHLVMTTRQDPPLDITNLRVKDQLTEVRLTDLRFSAAETQQYLENKPGDPLAPDLVRQIFEYTEGWAAGLRLTVLAMRNQRDQALFLENFQGSNQYIMSYLLSEVLAQQSLPIQNFLLQTSLLDRFSAPLCDALLLIEDRFTNPVSQETIGILQQESLFLIPLDQQGEWYRYHHPFQELLRHQLTVRFSASEIEDLHLRASTWLADQGFIEEALDHAFSAGAVVQAVEIFGQARIELIRQTQWQRLDHLLRRFPPEIIDQFPELLTAEMWLFYQYNQYSKLPAVFTRLEQLFSQNPAGGTELQQLLGEMNVLRSLLLFYAMDIDGVTAGVRQALELTNPKLGIVRVLARLVLAAVQQMAGDLTAAYETIYQSFEEPDQNNVLRASVLVTACYISWIAAELNTLQQNATQAIILAHKPSSPGMLGYGHYFLGMAAYCKNDLAVAEEHFTFVNQRPYATYDDSFVHGACGLALTHQAKGREQEALNVLDEAIAYLLATGNSDMLVILQAFQAELAWRQKQLYKAVQWAQQFAAPPPLSPMTHFYAPPMTLVKVWLAENSAASLEKAAGLLAQLKGFLQDTHNSVFLIETLALQALSQQMAGDESSALKSLEQALLAGLPGQFIRLFVDLGPAMSELLTSLAVDEPELAGFKRSILEAMPPANGQVQKSLASDDSHQLIAESLTNREMDVLSLLSQRQTDREIAGQLHISPHTVRTHAKNIYAKLGVANRRQASERAQKLGLVSSP